MRLTLRFDKDILTLISIPGFDFRKWIRDTLGTYASTGEVRRIPLPATSPDKPVLKDLMFSITFDKNRDTAVVELLSAVQDKQRSGVIKSILRCSLSHPCLYAHFKDYPAPYPVTKPEGSPSAEYIEPVAVLTEPVAVATVAPSVQAPSDAPDDFDVFGFDDRIK